MTDHDADTTQGISAQVPASDLHKVSKQATHKCSACASCCAGIALISTPATLPACDPATAVVAIPKAWAAGVVIDGPERPPRNFLA